MMDKLIGFIFVLVLTFAANILLAQVTVFGLSLYHINSGLLGPYLLICAATAIITLGVRAGTSE